ncbi:MAG: cytochrome c [Gammaproteobacteria bacterium]|nr:cytochrome c [Gammaproteobacteria bacterium]
MRSLSKPTNRVAACRALAMALMTGLVATPIHSQEVAPVASVASEEESLSDGQILYTQLCASCHGARGRGDGVVSSDVLLRPRDFALNAFKFDTDADWERGSDVDLANVIKNGPAAYGGSPLMPPWSTLSAEDIGALVSHIRVLQQQPGE